MYMALICALCVNQASANVINCVISTSVGIIIDVIDSPTNSFVLLLNNLFIHPSVSTYSLYQKKKKNGGGSEENQAWFTRSRGFSTRLRMHGHVRLLRAPEARIRHDRLDPPCH